MISKEDTVKEVRAALDLSFERFVSADIEGMEALILESAVLVAGKDIYRGREALMSFYGGFYAAFEVAENYPITVDIQLTGFDSAVVATHQKMILKPKLAEVSSVDIDLMVTFAFVKCGEEWRIAYEHASRFDLLFGETAHLETSGSNV
ncbi:YybH family protein [Rubellicoccus peritrichatus]|uniref:Nuclear transport factor 2 family protein n=1 Tax=Rubellicoccus peritrichatus TaxID=3080537 RepID=A0AAQ3LB88_9BACT|nr:nuclear transport factor 2 family protein [Puniceicoccus sp. CR14]WOO42117.1 nuclear transport factor 2 family protein [Puniceicoccus sp. CR14]